MVEYFLQRFHFSAVNVTLRGVTPLHVVCRNKNATADIVRCVIQYPGDLLKQDEGGQTPLVYLCFNKELDDKSSVEILTLILDKCPECAQRYTHKGYLPIHAACVYRSPKFCCLLVEAYPDSMLHQGSILHQVEGIQELDRVLFSPSVDDSVALAVLKLLLDKYPEDVRRLRINDCPFLHRAASVNISRAAEICRLLIRAFPELLFEHDENGYQALQSL